MKSALALHGGAPVRVKLLPYARQSVDAADVQAVVETLTSDWLTTGPTVERFEKALAAKVGAPEVVAISNGTSALHAAVRAAGIGPGDEVIVPALTFVATANSVVFEGGRPVFADVDPGTLLVDPKSIERLITPRTRAVISVDYGGQPCAHDEISRLARARGLRTIADAAHSLGATLADRPVGTLADLTTFSFHPAKHITTAEGGAIATGDPECARVMRRFRSHGIDSDVRAREKAGTFQYQMVDLGYNYRISDLQCSLGLSQLAHLEGWIARRRELAALYDSAFADLDFVEPLAKAPGTNSSYHLYVVQLVLDRMTVDRDTVYKALRAEGIGVNVHYLPVHLNPFYREKFGTREGECPAAESAYRRLLSLPMFPTMKDQDVTDVISAFEKVGHAFRAG